MANKPRAKQVSFDKTGLSVLTATDVQAALAQIDAAILALQVATSSSGYVGTSPTPIDSAVGGSGGGSTIAITLAAIPANGRLILGFFNVSQYSATRDLTVPSGWSLVGTPVSSGNDRLVIVSRVASSEASATYNWSITGGSEHHTGVMVVMSGGTVQASNIVATTTGSASVTDSVGGRRAIGCTVGDNYDSSAAAGSGYTMLKKTSDGGTFHSVYVEAKVSDTAAGTVTAGMTVGSSPLVSGAVLVG